MNRRAAVYRFVDLMVGWVMFTSFERTVGAPGGSVACNMALFLEVERPAGAGSPLLVSAVAVVRFFMIVLL